MTQHDDNVSLSHMLDHAREATGLIAGRSREDLNQDPVLKLALTRLAEIVGDNATD